MFEIYILSKERLSYVKPYESRTTNCDAWPSIGGFRYQNLDIFGK